MALFGKDDRMQRFDDVGPSTLGTPTRSAEAAPSEDAVQAHLGRGSRVEGKLTFEATVKIDGQIDGEIDAKEAVIIGETAVLTAQISAGTVIVKGKVTGDIVARKRVELCAPGKVMGNITTPSLVIHEGVFFEGHCSMGSAASGSGDTKVERQDKKVALFPKEDRLSAGPVRMTSEGAK